MVAAQGMGQELGQVLERVQVLVVDNQLVWVYQQALVLDSRLEQVVGQLLGEGNLLALGDRLGLVLGVVLEQVQDCYVLERKQYHNQLHMGIH